MVLHLGMGAAQVMFTYKFHSSREYNFLRLLHDTSHLIRPLSFRCIMFMHSALNGTFLPCTTLVPTNISSFTWLPALKLNAFVLHTICRVTFSFQTETQVRFTLRTNAAHILVPWAFYCQCEYPLTSSCHLGSPHDQLYCTSCSYLHITSILLAPIGSFGRDAPLSSLWSAFPVSW